MSIADIKLEARQAIHSRLAESCTYQDNYTAPVPLTVRFHTKAKLLQGDTDGLSIMENVEKLVFSQEELDALDIDLITGGVVIIEKFAITLVLDQPVDGDGPFNVYWTVTRSA